MNDLKIERMKKEPKYIAFSTQKGGAGKNNADCIGGKLPALCNGL